MPEAAAMGVTCAVQEPRITIDFGAIRLARLPRSGLPLSFRTVFIALANVDASVSRINIHGGKRWGAHLSLGSVDG